MRATLALNGLSWNPNFSESFFLLTLGFTGLVGALGYGVYAYKFRGPAMTTSRYLMRLRVVAQSMVVGSIIVGVGLTQFRNTAENKSR